MSLVSTVLGWVLRKLALLAATVLVLFAAFLLLQVAVPALREAAAERDRLEQVRQERVEAEAELERLRAVSAQARSRALAELGTTIAAEVEQRREDLTASRSRVEDEEEDEQDACSGLRNTLLDLLGLDACERAREALARAQEALATGERALGEAEDQLAALRDPDLTDEEKAERVGAEGDPVLARELATQESEVARVGAEERSLATTHDSVAGFVVDQWSRSWRWLLLLAVTALLAVPLTRVLAYFVLMPLVRRWHRPVHLADATPDAATDATTDAGTGAAARLRAGEARQTLEVRLGPGEVLSARAEHVRPVRGTVRSQVLHDWRAPFTSFAAGLHSLSRVTGDAEGSVATLAAPDDPDLVLVRIDLVDHPGLVMRPRHVVGVLGDLQLRTRWRWGLASLATWQVRYIMFAGTGSLVVQGRGDVRAEQAGGAGTRMDQHLVMGFDSRLALRVTRNEVFWPYLWGRTPLVVDEFTGTDRFFWQKSEPEGPTNPVARSIDAVLSALGKLLGF